MGQGIDVIIQGISTVGFPIVASVGMFYLYNKTITSLTETLSIMNVTLQDLKREIMKAEGEDKNVIHTND